MCLVEEDASEKDLVEMLDPWRALSRLHPSVDRLHAHRSVKNVSCSVGTDCCASPRADRRRPLHDEGDEEATAHLAHSLVPASTVALWLVDWNLMYPRRSSARVNAGQDVNGWSRESARDGKAMESPVLSRV